MRSIVHLSVLHFGRIDYTIIKPLIAAVTALNPHIIAISGDLTQRARTQQFKEARVFLDALPSPQIVVPGNHDVPLYNIAARFLEPLTKYRRYITNDLEPFYADDEIAVLGVNTARSLTFKHGRINEKQITRIATRFCHLADSIVKIVVTHHPFDLPEGHAANPLVGRAHLAMHTLARCGIDVLLAGHLHISHTGHTAERYKISGHSALVIQAGTATSTRSRGEANTFNVIHIDKPGISIERYSWQAEHAQFTVSAAEHFSHTKNGWVRVDSANH